MDKQLFYSSAEGMYWYEDEEGQKFYGFPNDVTDEEAESAIDRNPDQSFEGEGE